MCLELSCKVARSIVLMAVESCSKAILAQCLGHGKSPCFLRYAFLHLFGVDGAVLVFASVNVKDFLECAF
jgi:hypothetical protein